MEVVGISCVYRWRMYVVSDREICLQSVLVLFWTVLTSLFSDSKTSDFNSFKLSFILALLIFSIKGFFAWKRTNKIRHTSTSISWVSQSLHQKKKKLQNKLKDLNENVSLPFSGLIKFYCNIQSFVRYLLPYFDSLVVFF